MHKFLAAALALPACFAFSPWELTIVALWLLPNWVGQWLDIRDRWDPEG